jgi:hypothetical protein
MVKRSEREADHLPPYIAVIKNVWSRISTLPYGVLHIYTQGQFYFRNYTDD